MNIPLIGAGVSLAAGLLLGAAMQPHLDAVDARPGPQLFANTAGARADERAASDTTLISYRGKVPDYVFGTDWKKSMAPPEAPVAVSASIEAARDIPTVMDEPPSLTRARYEEPLRAHNYPSMEGENPSVLEILPVEAPDAGGLATGR